MNFKTHNEINGMSIDGTSYRGEISANYADLHMLFGEPLLGDGYKTDAEWWVQFDDGTLATIYNWKNGRNYMGDDGLDIEQITEWNVGGRCKQALDMVIKTMSTLDE